ncbi:MAG: site-2 protease family protein [Clostridia bacterium]|nr:site-2 protease family protein [Clostridia bacterium]
MSYLITIAASVIAVLFVFIPHELAHAFVAYKNGDYTAKMYGRLTLNPLKHIDPLGIVLCIFTGFGWAKPVPINPANFTHYRRGLFTTAVAGVITNYIIAFIAYPLYLVISVYALPEIEAATSLYYLVSFFDRIFFLIFLYSLSVFIFNLLPLYPLDGFRVVESLTREVNPVRRFLRNYGYYILIFLVLESFLCDKLVQYTDLSIFEYFDILGYVQWFARNIIGFPITALWNAVFGLPVGI